ncbi:MAG: flagellar biosynthetic protein FliR [Betaproteobacteria bacterium]|nr:flagellar biosynthetic protein FliR [Betaproteobacteria bacterium]
MITVTSAQLAAWLAAYAWPFARIIALFSTDPIIGSPSVPARVKIGLSLLIAFVLSPTLGPFPAVDPGSAAGLLILMQQIVIGTAMGLVLRVVLAGVETAGQYIGLQMGLGFATLMDPQNAAQVPVLGEFTNLFAILVFFSFNGHLMVLSALAESFHLLPVSATVLSGEGWHLLGQWGADIFLAAAWLSLPVVATLLITNLAIGVMTRAAPQVNIFSVGFPITLAAGFAILYLTLPFALPLVERFWRDAVGMMLEVVRLAAPRG